MHNPEGDTNMLLRRDSSQTLTKGRLHHAIGEEVEDCQLPKQVHATESFQAPYVDTCDEAENNRSYRSATELGDLTKNMKESFDTKRDYRIEQQSRTLAQKCIQSKEPM